MIRMVDIQFGAMLSLVMLTLALLVYSIRVRWHFGFIVSNIMAVFLLLVIGLAWVRSASVA